jgi:hypothetical protein
VKITAAIDSFLDWLLDLLGFGASETQQPEVKDEPDTRAPDSRAPDTRMPSIEMPPAPDPIQEALAYLDRVEAKVHKLAADFNAGTINRAQFRSLYAHYQQQIQSVEGLIEAAPGSDDWKEAVTEGRSIVIRRQHRARARGYAIFENESGMPVSTLGEFELDSALFVPMLSSYRAAAREIFGAGSRLTEMEDGRWLCFVPGEFTTMLALFSAEPASKQLQFLGELHRQFEQANRRYLSRPPLDPSRLIFPHEYYLGQWRR